MSVNSICPPPTNTTYCSDNAFAADPDVAGIGVFVAFATTSALVCALSFIYLTWQWCKWFQWRQSTSETDDKERAQSKFLETTIGACNDTQILTGMAYLLGAIGRSGISCDISAYHWNIVADMALVSAATFMVTVTVSKGFFENRLLGIARVFLVGVHFVRLYQMSSSDIPYPIPDEVKHNITTLVQPAACALGTGLSTSDTRAQILANLVLGSLVVCVCIRLIPPFLSQLIRLAHLSPTAYRRWSMGFNAVVQWPVFGFGTYIIGKCIRSIKNQRTHMNGTFFLGQENPENSIHTFGQYIPLVLLALIPLAMLEAWFDHYKEKRTEVLRTVMWKRLLWLFVLGPERADYEVIGNTELLEGIALVHMNPIIVV
ncbi:hypothetical protein LTR42_005395 [Elasticomyces elasticus]|nr:hypothetical protein LTR42_005395 [Elasticomyces elasticus]